MKFLDQYNALLNEAEAFANAGEMDKYEAKVVEAETLQANHEKAITAKANLDAMRNVAKPAIPVQTGGLETVVKPVDTINSVEYRQAFMNYCQTGVKAPIMSNIDAASETSDVAALIPTTILDETIKEMKTYGQIFNRIRKLSIKGGLTVPISTVKPVATWTAEGSVSDRQKLGVSGSVTFSYFKLDCRIATSLIAEATTLGSFETLITELMAEAFAKALDAAVISGVGTTQPLGITADTRVLAGQKLTLTPANVASWADWKKEVFAKIPLSYNNGEFIMAKGTFDGYIDGMVDSTGQPIGRVTYGIDGTQSARFAGKEVIQVEDDIVTPYDTAGTGDVFAIYCKLSDYAMNSNMNIMAFHWFDHDTDQWVDKMVLIADGKLLDAKGVLLIKKGA